jgi:splicing factor 3A subunit 1
VDKTAAFVARNGPEFEARIQENERGNPKFSFLQLHDAYRKYYDLKVLEGKHAGKEGPGPGEAPAPVPVPSLRVLEHATGAAPMMAPSDAESAAPKEPYPFDFITDIPPISPLDLYDHQPDAYCHVPSILP